MSERISAKYVGAVARPPAKLQCEQPFCMYPIAERFVSINGEGANAGRLASFIRFAGCNLKCSYCDTAWAQSADSYTEQLSTSEIARWIADTGCACVTLTGGEPLLQEGIRELVDALGALDSVEVVEMETNGSVDISSLANNRLHKLCITLDCKCPASGESNKMLASNFEHLFSRDVVKFVVGNNDDLVYMRETIKRYNLDTICSVFVSPVFGCMDPADIVQFLIENNLNCVRLQLQLHKLIWPNVERGV